MYAWKQDNRVQSEAPSLLEFIAANLAAARIVGHRHVDAKGQPRPCRNMWACLSEAVEIDTDTYTELSAARYMPLPYEDPYEDPYEA